MWNLKYAKQIGGTAMNQSSNITYVSHPRKSEYQEHHKYHRKSISIDFKLESDQNNYDLQVQNSHYETGERKVYYTISIKKKHYKWDESDKDEFYFEDIEQHINKTTPFIDKILNHPNVKMFYDWMKINKPPEEIGHDGL